MNTAEALTLYLAGELPDDIKVLLIPTQRTACSDLQVRSQYLVPMPNTPGDHTFVKTEDIPIDHYRGDDGESHWAGYGPDSKTLVLVTFTELPKPADRELGNKVIVTSARRRNAQEMLHRETI